MNRLWIEPPMSEQACAAWVTPDERARAAAFAPARRREWLGWRALLRRELARDGCARAEIAYDAVGAPVLPGLGLRVSVAHCRDRVAVLLSDGPCGVDIESVTRDFSRVAARCLTEAERCLSDEELFPAAAWCSKEALYKRAGRRGVDLRRDIVLTGFARCTPADASGASGASGVTRTPGASGVSDTRVEALGAAVPPDGLPAGYAPWGAMEACVAGDRLTVALLRGEGYLIACV